MAANVGLHNVMYEDASVNKDSKREAKVRSDVGPFLRTYILPFNLESPPVLVIIHYP